ncbi:tigger transposable element-derived protein 1 [Trichonephila clavipes]|nr:tigger transposable element-derived protein 1 [Trichonephila clavipes]
MKQSEPSTSTSQAGKEFSASKGWLTGFLKRNALHNIKITGESATADEGAAKIFPEKLALPNRTYIAKDEKTASGHKESKDRVTLLLCSNASGDRMLKPLLINKSLRPRTPKSKDLKQLPVHWMANPKTWMTTAFSTEWFKNCFVPEVEAYMKEKSLDFKVLLIVDDAANLTVDGVVGLEGDNDEEEKSTPLTGKLIQEGLQLCSKLENHFLINDPNSERAL